MFYEVNLLSSGIKSLCYSEHNFMWISIWFFKIFNVFSFCGVAIRLECHTSMLSPTTLFQDLQDCWCWGGRRADEVTRGAPRTVWSGSGSGWPLCSTIHTAKEHGRSHGMNFSPISYRNNCEFEPMLKSSFYFQGGRIYENNRWEVLHCTKCTQRPTSTNPTRTQEKIWSG